MHRSTYNNVDVVISNPGQPAWSKLRIQLKPLLTYIGMPMWKDSSSAVDLRAQWKQYTIALCFGNTIQGIAPMQNCREMFAKGTI